MLKSLVTGTLLLASVSAAQAANMYCCTDNGRKVCGDGLPEQCRGKAYRILDGSGNLLKEVGPPLTAEQKAQIEAEAQRKKELEAARQEAKRRDQALLDTYASVQDIDKAMARAEDEVRENIKQAESKVVVAKQRRQKLEAEKEFYQKKALPPELEKNIKAAEEEIKAQTEFIESKRGDFARIKSKFDQEKQRYIEITAQAKR